MTGNTPREQIFMAHSRLSDVLAHALTDLATAEATGAYKRHNFSSHEPDGKDRAKISLCGAVLAITLGANRAKRLYGFNVGNAGIELRTNAVTQLESGKVSSALSEFGRSGAKVDAGANWATACELHRRFCIYRGPGAMPKFTDPKWDAWVRGLLTEMRSAGL